MGMTCHPCMHVLRRLSRVRSGLHMVFPHKEAAVTQTDVPNVHDECCDWPRTMICRLPVARQLFCYTCLLYRNGFDSNRRDQSVPCRDWSCAMIGQLQCDAEKQLLQVSCLCSNTGSIRVQQECMFSLCFIEPGNGPPSLLARKPLPCMGARSVIYIYIILVRVVAL